jgi:hypothetical protein
MGLRGTQPMCGEEMEGGLRIGLEEPHAQRGD